jgi:hypothetical protein
MSPFLLSPPSLAFFCLFRSVFPYPSASRLTPSFSVSFCKSWSLVGYGIVDLQKNDQGDEAGAIQVGDGMQSSMGIVEYYVDRAGTEHKILEFCSRELIT